MVVPAAGLLLISMILDCADGQLARLRGGGSLLGRMLDGTADYVSALAVHIGMALYLSEYINHAWLWTAGAALSMAAHSIYYDFKKQWFLSGLIEGYSDTVEDNPETGDPGNEISSGFLRGAYRVYQFFQRGVSSKKTEYIYIQDSQSRQDFLTKRKPFMNAVRLIGPAGHNCLIVLFMLLSALFDKAIFLYMLLVIFPFNILFIFLISWDKAFFKKQR